MMKPVARTDIRVVKPRLEQRLNRSDRGKLIGSAESDLEAPVTAHRDTGDECRFAIAPDVARSAKMREEILGDEALPSRAAIRMVEVVAHRAGAAHRHCHRRNDAVAPPSLEQRPHIDQVLMAPTAAVQE